MPLSSNPSQSRKISKKCLTISLALAVMLATLLVLLPFFRLEDAGDRKDAGMEVAGNVMTYRGYREIIRHFVHRGSDMYTAAVTDTISFHDRQRGLSLQRPVAHDLPEEMSFFPRAAWDRLAYHPSGFAEGS